MKKIILTSFVLIVANFAMSQQSTRYSQYRFYPMLINPASTGNIGNIQIATGLKAMWNNVPGAPRTQFLAADGSFFRKKFGWGVEIQNDAAALLKQRKILGNFAYRHRLGKSKWLSVGLGAGVKQHIFDGTQAVHENPMDAAFPHGQINAFRPSINFGGMYFQRNAFVGLSVESLYQYQVDYTGMDREDLANAVSRYFLTAGYDFKISDKWVYRQMILFKFEAKNPSQFDFTPMVEFNKKTTFGLSYRHEESISVIFQNQLGKAFKFGYAYDFQTNGLNTVTNGSHELMLMYTIDNSRFGYKNPRYF